MDNGTDKVYQYIGAASRTSGSQNAAATFALAAGNTNPQGIADPPPGSSIKTANTRRDEGLLARPRSHASLAPRYFSQTVITQDPGRQLGIAPDVGVPAQLDSIIPALPTARLAVGLSKRLRPTLWPPANVGLE